MVKYWKTTLAAGAVAALLAACGGGGGGGGAGSGAGSDAGGATDASSLNLTGTAATGFALVDSNVDVKCATGSGTATTNNAGGYTVTVVDGKLPCIVKVTGTAADGAPVTLHSVAEAGTTSGSTTTATANVTPLTELIVAQLAGSLPGSYFDSFGAGTTVTSEQLSAATSTLLTALKDATGIDLGTIDPFKSTLVPATQTTAGNAYDVALDALNAKISLETLPLVVNQVAAATTSGGGETVTLNEVLTNANAGTLANCPTALSGKYRVVDYRGATDTFQIDFSRNVIVENDGAEIAFTPSASQACEIAVNDGNGTQVVFGPQGVAALRDNFTTGFVFPVQSLGYGAVVGGWNFVESGIDDISNAPIHFVGKFTFNADKTSTVCDYELGSFLTRDSVCQVDEEVPTVTERADGGLQVNYGDGGVSLYGYRGPNGTLALFGTTNPTGATTAGTLRTHFVAYKPTTIVLPAVGPGRQTWGMTMRALKSDITAIAPTALRRVTQEVTAVDSAAGTYSRVQSTAPTVTDVFTINSPFEGAVSRTQNAIYAFETGLGIVVAIDAATNPAFLYDTTVVRP